MSIHQHSAEPIPTYTKQELDELFYCIDRAYLGYFLTTQEIIATVFYNIIKNHYLSNGNKRIAVIIIITLLVLEKFSADQLLDNLENLALKIASNELSKAQLVEIFAVLIKG